MNGWFLLVGGFVAGAVAAYLALKRRSFATASAPGDERLFRKERRVQQKAVEYRLSFGPEIVVVGGGTGLSTLLRGLKAFTRNLTAIVTVTDEGGSSGRLREEWGVLPPGDIRNCLVALAEDDNTVKRIFNFRFDRGELKGHSLGNLILLAINELVGDFYTAVKQLNRILATRGRVLPVTSETVVLHGETEEGDLVRGEIKISENGCRLKRIWLEPANAKPIDDVVAAISQAELIVLGPGSLFTSIIPNLLIEDVTNAIKESQAPKIYVANLMTQSCETEGMNILAHLDWLTGLLGQLPDYLVVNQTPIPPDYLERYIEQGAAPLYLSAEEENYLCDQGTRVVFGDFVDVKEGGVLRHHAQNLAETLTHLARGAASTVQD